MDENDEDINDDLSDMIIDEPVPSTSSAQTNNINPFSLQDALINFKGNDQEMAAARLLLGILKQPFPSQAFPDIPNTSKPPVDRIPLTKRVVLEGWVMKRGEHIKNWRHRYFKLREDGTFHGYKVCPVDDNSPPCNNFTVKDCQIWTSSKPKPFTFMIRGLQIKNVVQRTFYVESEDNRKKWIDAIKHVSDSLKRESDQPTSVKECDIDLDSFLQPIKKYSLKDFERIKVIGVGSFGKVFLCKERETGCFYAMKMMKKSVIIEKDEVNHTIFENKVLQIFRHPFMAELKYSFTSKDYIFLVMEFVNGGELYTHLSKERRFSEERVKIYAAEIVLVLGYLHDRNVVYRDLKLENILLDSEGHIKIIDFGLCKDISSSQSTSTFCGTPEYLAPELLKDDEYSFSVDWWTLGVVMYEMLCGSLPFFNVTQLIMFRMITNQSIALPDWLSVSAKDILIKLLNKDPKKRLGGGPAGALDVMCHPFFKDVEWTKLIKRDIAPPFKPLVSGPCDTKYFSEEFLKLSTEIPSQNQSRTDLHSLTEATNAATSYFEKFSFYGSQQSID